MTRADVPEPVCGNSPPDDWLGVDGPFGEDDIEFDGCGDVDIECDGRGHGPLECDGFGHGWW